MGKVCELALEFKKKYPNTVARRIKKHSAEIGMKLNKRPCYKICDIVV